MSDPLARLHAVLDAAPSWTIAVSGGVDSMTLATLAHRRLATPPRMVHATSPAVPAAARPLVEQQAIVEGWDLLVIEAGEFADPDYRANPVNRCYFCKSNLYGALAALAAHTAEGSTLASGTNLDDLGDFRPGLRAAEEHGVRHPFVEAGIDKAGIRALARDHGLPFADLPAQPCLSSRVETSLAIDPAELRFIDELEAELRAAALGLPDLRVRIRRGGVAVEAGDDASIWPDLSTIAARRCADAGRAFIGVEAYKRGSAFLREAS